jgi:hypothetical protein
LKRSYVHERSSWGDSFIRSCSQRTSCSICKERSDPSPQTSYFVRLLFSHTNYKLLDVLCEQPLGFSGLTQMTSFFLNLRSETDLSIQTTSLGMLQTSLIFRIIKHLQGVSGFSTTLLNFVWRCRHRQGSFLLDTTPQGTPNTPVTQYSDHKFFLQP